MTYDDERMARLVGQHTRDVHLDLAACHLYHAERAEHPDWPAWESDDVKDVRTDTRYRIMGAVRRGIPSCRFVGIERVASALANLDGEIWPFCDRHVPPTATESQKAAIIAQRRQRYRHEARTVIAEYIRYMEVEHPQDTEEGRTYEMEQAKSQHTADAHVSAKWRGSIGVSQLTTRLIIIMACVVGLYGCASSTLGKSLNVAVVASASADVMSTHIALRSGCCSEANAVFGSHPHTATLIAAKAGSTSLIIWLASILEENNHPRWAHVARGMATGVWMGVTAHNVRVMLGAK